MNKKLFAIFLALMIAIPGYAIFANNDSDYESVDEKSNSKRSGRFDGLREKNSEEAKEARTAKKCEIATNRVQNKAKEMQNNLNMYTKVHDKTISRLNRLAGVLSGKGLDTENLVGQIGILQGKMDNLESTYDGFIKTLNTNSASACTDKNAFKSSFRTSKENFRAIKALRNEIRNYINGPIKTELKSLRQQLEETDTEDEDADQNEVKKIKFTSLENPGSCLAAKSQCNTCSRTSTSETFACTQAYCENEAYKCTKYLGDEDEAEESNATEIDKD